MTARSSVASYAPGLGAFHWSMAGLILLALAIGTIAVESPRRPLRADLPTVHKSLGVTVLALVAFGRSRAF